MIKLLTLEDIASLHSCNLAFARRIVLTVGFPKPVPTSTPRKRYWLESEVMRFLSREYAQDYA